VDDSSTVGINATFGATLAGTVAIGMCSTGLYGLPQRQCNLDGNWATALLQNPCSGTAAP